MRELDSIKRCQAKYAAYGSHPPKIRAQTVRSVQAEVYRHYRSFGRAFPWRYAPRPYQVFVSEYMLQQTQAERVGPYYERFLRQFPSFKTLAGSELAVVLKAWQGLGYNRRARSLRDAAAVVADRYHSRLPRTEEELMQLPGIGPYTAGAICAFAFNQPAVIVETNIRSACLFLFFDSQESVDDKQVLEVLDRILDRDCPRDWYHALMDYGYAVKKVVKGLNARSRHYRKQGAFNGSRRQLRGAVIRLMVAEGALSIRRLSNRTGVSSTELRPVLANLVDDGLIRISAGKYVIA